jgi:hypothetical protein
MAVVLTNPLPEGTVIVWEFGPASYSIHAGILVTTAETLEAALRAARRLAGEASEIVVRRADRTIERLLGRDIDVAFGREER